MDFEALKRLGLAYMNIDCEKSYESYNETNNNHIINIYLKKDENTCCPNCGSNNVISRGSIKRTLEFANTAENNITLIWQRKRFTVQKNIKILQTLKDINTNYTFVAKAFDVSPTYVIDLFDRKVDISRGPLTQVICVDEVYASKLTKHKFCFIL